MAKEKDLEKLYQGFGNISNINFGNTPPKVADPLLDDEVIAVPKEEEEVVDTPKEPNEEEYETVPKVNYGDDGQKVEIGEDGEEILDGDDFPDEPIGTSNIDSYEALAHQIIEGLLNPAITFIGSNQYDKYVRLNEVLEHTLTRLEVKMSDGKMSPSEQKMYSTIKNLKIALAQARELYHASLPLTDEEKELTKQAILDYCQAKNIEVTPESILLTNLASIFTKRAMPIVTDRYRFYKAEV